MLRTTLCDIKSFHFWKFFGMSSRSLNIGNKTVLQNEAASKLLTIALIHVSKHRLQCMAAIFRLGSAGGNQFKWPQDDYSDRSKLETFV
jgi:hypothetical protein